MRHSRPGRPSKVPIRDPQHRIRELRERAGLTTAELGAAIGVSNTRRYESGEYQIDLGKAIKLARALGTTPDRLLPRRAVPIVGRLDAHGVVHSIAAGWTALCPGGIDEATTEAVIVGESGIPTLAEGWVLFYSSGGAGVPAAAVNHLCILELAEGGYRMREVRRGFEPGRYNLFGLNAPPAENVALRWAAPVLAMLRPDLAEVEPDWPPAGA